MLIHSAFYQFAPIANPHEFAEWLRTISVNINGSILVAHEGINGTVAGGADAIDLFESTLKSHTLFKEMRFKHSGCTTPPFGLMRIHVKPEIVQMGVKPVDAINHQPNALSPTAWAEVIDNDAFVVIDNRNRFEFELGHFKGAINPDISHFKDFPNYIQSNLPLWQAQGKKIAMYCTGGIRCDKTSAWLSEQGIESVVLDGGILNFFAQSQNANTFEGECFVFDNRIALNHQLQQTQTSAEQVFANEPDAQWRIARANQLRASATAPVNTKQHPSLFANRSKLVTPPGEYTSMFDFFCKHFAHVAAEQWLDRFENNEITAADGHAISTSAPFVPNTVFYYNRASPNERRIPFEATIVYEDDVLVVADKPHFLSVAPSGNQVNETLLLRLRRQLNCSALSPAHRLDRDTAGLVLFTKQKIHRGAYQNLFRDRYIKKLYWAIARFDPAIEFPRQVINRLDRSPDHFMQAASQVGIPNAQTTIELLSNNQHWGLYQLVPSTGQRHQLRVHMNELGLAILNDEIYPTLHAEVRDTDKDWAERFKRPMQLLAKELQFTDPLTGQLRQFLSQQTLHLPTESNG